MVNRESDILQKGVEDEMETEWDKIYSIMQIYRFEIRNDGGKKTEEKKLEVIEEILKEDNNLTDEGLKEDRLKVSAQEEVKADAKTGPDEEFTEEGNADRKSVV